MVWSPDGKRLGAGVHNNNLQLWGASGVPGPTLEHNRGHVPSIAWLPDSARLALGSYEPTVWLRDITGLPGPALTLHPESDAAFVAWTAKGSKLVAAGHAGFVRVWDAKTLETEWISFQTAPFDVTLFSTAGRVPQGTPAAVCERTSSTWSSGRAAGSRGSLSNEESSRRSRANDEIQPS